MPYLLHVSAVRRYLNRPSCLVNVNIKKIKITHLFINSGQVPPSCAPLHASHLLRSTSDKSSWLCPRNQAPGMSSSVSNNLSS